jgi:Protein of unknown function (DUF3306)
MSEAEKPAEPFLARWFRRKRQAVEEADAKAAGAAAADASSAEPAGSEENPIAGELAKQLAAIETPAELPFDPATLPPIESITAETDIRAFLAPGVPPELKLEALRRAWAADPTIREFVGLADYAWDYNTPGSMPGFGPLELTDEMIQKMVDRIVGRAVADRGDASKAEARESTATDEASRGHVEDGGREVLGALPEPTQGRSAEAAPDMPMSDSVQSRDFDQLRHSDANHGAVQNPAQKNKDLQPPARRHHGGALPKS